MEEHLGEPITIEEIAARSGWSHEHFTRVFVVSLGMTPKRMSAGKTVARRVIDVEGSRFGQTNCLFGWLWG